MSPIKSYTNWSPLEEVWLGDVYPASWYDHLPSEVRDCFYEITERTKQDLDYIQKTVESFGVKVCRPNYDSIDKFMNHYDQLKKPEICPRDRYLTFGEILYAEDKFNTNNAWQEHINRYKSQGGLVKTVLRCEKNNNFVSLVGANSVRAGRDIYFDFVWNVQNSRQSKLELVELYKENFTEEFKDYRVHLLFNGGHVDGCFALLKPGIILGSRYFDDYERTFPNWKVFNVTEPEFIQHRQRKGPWFNGRWWVPGVYPTPGFNEHLIKHAQTWIGDYTETFFEVNCLVIDEKNVVIPGENELVFRELEKQGITAHPVPFRTRTFWDGGMHCITLDIRRRGDCPDLFPERGPAGIIVYD